VATPAAEWEAEAASVVELAGGWVRVSASVWESELAWEAPVESASEVVWGSEMELVSAWELASASVM